MFIPSPYFKMHGFNFQQNHRLHPQHLTTFFLNHTNLPYHHIFRFTTPTPNKFETISNPSSVLSFSPHLTSRVQIVHLSTGTFNSFSSIQCFLSNVGSHWQCLQGIFESTFPCVVNNIIKQKYQQKYQQLDALPSNNQQSENIGNFYCDTITRRKPIKDDPQGSGGELKIILLLLGEQLTLKLHLFGISWFSVNKCLPCMPIYFAIIRTGMRSQTEVQAVDYQVLLTV